VPKYILCLMSSLTHSIRGERRVLKYITSVQQGFNENLNLFINNYMLILYWICWSASAVRHKDIYCSKGKTEQNYLC